MSDDVKTATTWNYWRPPEGGHVVDPNELHVGITRDEDDGTFSPVWVAAVIPPFGPLHGGRYDQPEGFAAAVRDVLAQGDWTKRNGLADWLSAHGFPLQWPGEDGR